MDCVWVPSGADFNHGGHDNSWVRSCKPRSNIIACKHRRSAIIDPTDNICLTVRNLATAKSNLTITRSTCLANVSTLPHPSQAFGWLTTPGTTQNPRAMLVFLGSAEPPTLGVPTNFSPSFNGTLLAFGRGLWVDLTEGLKSFVPTNDTIAPIMYFSS
jgi:hypothetical protein